MTRCARKMWATAWDLAAWLDPEARHKPGLNETLGAFGPCALWQGPCVRQTPLYKRHESGNAMKAREFVYACVRQQLPSHVRLMQN